MAKISTTGKQILPQQTTARPTAGSRTAVGRTIRTTPQGANPQDYAYYLSKTYDVGLPVTRSGYNAYAGSAGVQPTTSTSPSYPGGGSSGGGGGGGGGTGSTMTQQMFDAMMQVLGTQGSGLQLQQTDLPDYQAQSYQQLPAYQMQSFQDLPDFQGQDLPAFNAAPYDLASQQLAQAVAADQANAAANAQATTQALQGNYTNSYANQTVTPGATTAAPGVGLMATTGAAPGATQGAADQANAQNQNSQAAFTNLLGVLAANANQSQQSRLNQVALDKNTALQGINAQNLGLGAGINQARTKAQGTWAQQDAERKYQNQLMAQQWARDEAQQAAQWQAQQSATAQQWEREQAQQAQQWNAQQSATAQEWARQEAMGNQDVYNQQQQANWSQRNSQMQSMLQPLMDLLAQTSGTGINTSALQQLLAGWGQ